MLFQVSFACFISSIIEIILAQFYLELYYLAKQDLKVIFVEFYVIFAMRYFCQI